MTRPGHTPFKHWALAASGACTLLLGACGALAPAARPVVFDFGPGVVATAPATSMARMPTITLPDVEAPLALEGTPVYYRLMYADAQQLRPYSLARWSMPPAQLLRQRLREQLGQRRTVLAPGEAAPVLPVTSVQAFTNVPAVVRVELEEFSQLFDTPQLSNGLVRVRATVLQTTTAGTRTAAQQTFVVQQAATTADAAGGVKALAQATDVLITQLDAWLQKTLQVP